jgi:hypothetical protein
VTLDTEVVMQAARYVRFSIGLGLDYLTPHLITGAAACNAEVSASASDARAGSCTKGIFNPVYRPVIDAPGRRFQLQSELSWRLIGTATAQF